MRTDGLPLWRKSNSAVAMISIALLSGCVSATIDTPQGLVGPNPLPTTSEVLSLESTGEFPTPTPRPGTLEIVAAPAEPVEVETAIATPTATPPAPAPVVAQAAGDPEKTDVNLRIASAETAPVAGNAEATEIVEVVAIEPKPVAPPPQMVATARASSAPGSGGFLNSLFGKNSNRKSPPAAIATAAASPAPAPEPKAPPRIIATASAAGSASALPGVNRERALGLDSGNATAQPIQVASAAGLARLTPNGLKTQHAGVDVKCLKPALVRVLKTIEKRYGKPVVVTSGYRSSQRNASIRGAKNSLHIYCAAADIQVEGVDKWTLAKYLRSMPGRGGVGTYCHTKSVHIDIGPQRDWNWRCRRR